MQVKLGLTIVGMVLAMVAANLLLKIGAQSPGWRLWEQGPVLNWTIVAAFAVSGVAATLYIAVLGVLPLHLGQVFVALGFVCVTISASLVLGESIPAGRWVGLAMIAAGMAVVGGTTF